jgi:hypothetical protein
MKFIDYCAACIIVSAFFPLASFASIAVEGGLKIDKIVKPGDTMTGLIRLKNNGNAPCEVKIQKTDYLFSADGINSYGEPGSSPRSNAQWLTLSPTRLVIPPNEAMSVHYSVKVPADARLKGSYWSMVMVEPVPDSSPESTKGKASKHQVGIQTILRYGIQFVTDLGDTGERKLRFLNKKVVGEKKRKTFQFELENTGERWLSPSVWVELYDVKGAQIGRFEGNRLRVYPKCSVKQQINLANVPAGNYRALVIADNGDDYVFGARYDLAIP